MRQLNYQLAFEAATSDPRYLATLDWGSPREGHPEGSIRAHISELEGNLQAFRSRIDETEFWKLRLLIHIHDTFKPNAAAGVAIADPRSHASLARSFLAEHCADSDLCAMVQNHDVPFALFRQAKSAGDCDRNRLESLVNAITDWDLFLAFLIIDGCTAGKSRDKLHWFFGEVRDRVVSRFSASDIL